MRNRLFACIACVALLGAAEGPLAAVPPGAGPQFLAPGAVDGVEVDPAKVEYGRLRDFKPEEGKPVGEVRPKDVYLEIPAYQTILKERIEKGTARWNQLMREATAAYKRAIRRVGEQGGYVLIVQEGGISGYPTTDVTQEVIDAL